VSVPLGDSVVEVSGEDFEDSSYIAGRAGQCAAEEDFAGASSRAVFAGEVAVFAVVGLVVGAVDELEFVVHPPPVFMKRRPGRGGASRRHCDPLGHERVVVEVAEPVAWPAVIVSDRLDPGDPGVAFVVLQVIAFGSGCWPRCCRW
jgi:hypothetical protein